MPDKRSERERGTATSRERRIVWRESRKSRREIVSVSPNGGDDTEDSDDMITDAEMEVREANSSEPESGKASR